MCPSKHKVWEFPLLWEMEGLNVIFLILNAFSATLPVPVGFVHLRLVVSLEENQLLHNQSQ